MVVADGTAGRQAHENSGGCVGTVHGVSNEQFGINRATFAGGHVAAIES